MRRPPLYTVRLSDPRVGDGAPAEWESSSRLFAVSIYREVLATMWRRPGASLQLAHGDEVLTTFRYHNPDRHHFNGLLLRQRATQAVQA